MLVKPFELELRPFSELQSGSVWRKLRDNEKTTGHTILPKAYPFAIREDAYPGVAVVAGHDVTDIGFSSCVPSQSGVNCYFIEVVVVRMVVYQWRYSPLKYIEIFYFYF